MAEIAGQLGAGQPRRFQPYPEYRESGVAWLGAIPAHWEANPLKRSFRVVNGSTPKSGEPDNWDGDIPWVTPEDLGRLSERVLNEPARYITRKGYENCGTRMVPAGSLVLSTRAPIGHLAISGTSICTNQGCRSLVFRHSGNETHAYFQLYAARPMLKAAGRGSTFMELAKQDLESVVLAVPPLGERIAIAAFLDRETAKIDALVEKKERLIELLQEKRTALITRAVTRGLDPNVPMKDSGVEWLGEIPANWEMKPLSYKLERITYGFTNPMPTADEGPYMLTALDIGDGQILYENARRTTNDAFERDLTDKSRPRGGDLLLTKDGTLGRVAVADGRRVAINQSIALLRFDRSVHVDFMQHMLLAAPYQDRMAFEAGGTTIKHIYISRLARMPIGIPPKEDQNVISDFVGQKKTKADILIANIQQAVQHLHEYRTALISAAVTGKIDVRKEVG